MTRMLPTQKGVMKVPTFGITGGIRRTRAAELVAAGLRGNGERMRKWTENEEMDRE